jgi:excisionase family DNA binding protein
MEPLLTTDDVATILRVDAVTVRRMVQRGELDAYRVAGEYRFSTDLLQAYLARQRLSRPGASTDLARSFPRLGPAARTVLEQAQAEAHALGHDYLGTEHVLLGLLTLQTGAATRALEAADVSAAAARTHLLALLGGPAASPARRRHQPRDGALTVMPRLKQSLERAGREAHADAILPEHLLVGLLADREAVAVRVLLALGIAPEDLARRVRNEAGRDEAGRDEAGWDATSP